MTNKAGIKPLEFNVLVEVDKVDEKTAGGIILPDVTKDTEQVAATTGTVLDVSKTAFTFEDGAEVVTPGDRIAFARYAGMRVKGSDGEEYLIIKDKDVSAVYQQ